MTPQELNDWYDFNREDAEQIEAQFPQEKRGKTTWLDLFRAMQTLTPEQRKQPVVLVNKFDGEVSTPIDLCLVMHIGNPALNEQVTKVVDNPEVPVLVY